MVIIAILQPVCAGNVHCTHHVDFSSQSDKNKFLSLECKINTIGNTKACSDPIYKILLRDFGVVVIIFAGTETPSRTSRGTFFTGASAQQPLILEVESRISHLMSSPAVIAGKKKLVNSEALQVVAYNKGDFYTGEIIHLSVFWYVP